MFASLVMFYVVIRITRLPDAEALVIVQVIHEVLAEIFHGLFISDGECPFLLRMRGGNEKYIPDSDEELSQDIFVVKATSVVWN